MPENTPAARTEEALCLALYSAMHATLDLYRDLLAPWGLSFQQLMVLGLLWDEGETAPGRIAEALLLDSSSVAGLLGRLQTAGLVERHTDPSDRRRVRVTLTDRSREIAGQLSWLEDCLTRAINLDPARAQALVDQLHALRDTVNAFPRPVQNPVTASA